MKQIRKGKLRYKPTNKILKEIYELISNDTLINEFQEMIRDLMLSSNYTCEIIDGEIKYTFDDGVKEKLDNLNNLIYTRMFTMESFIYQKYGIKHKRGNLEYDNDREI